ncbi:SRPBCC family protein [Actinophytocola xanthii]|uniref:Polyketide cyclase n=1 Tax=Actinophytocola xanthii TaxID=1912961 RepID=A0A1Q8CC64_9PSEU|nr:SRPBCC domain-containing protein [Actinophytocola xanthii]OLF11926.1 polyketide cyclase [Actinophytocola xanthii]
MTENNQLRTINVDQFVARPPEVVWRSLTEPELLARWWASGDIAPVVGHRFTLDMGRRWGHVPCTVTEVEPTRRLSYTFADWTLTWRLVAEGAGTRLFLEHSGFDLDDQQHAFAFRNMSSGWTDVLGKLERDLEPVGGR